ncbi:ATP phosphoribosyltransferase regulatory subunit [Ottowia testudinis]|uniref:ATP phosphoribosyltransferase regulatory subunit n=1 Tax=Ottowia testudinis TaxID=2816950 RepID=A0A975CET3_9BURK|nr:ATP phosphoribosyltransferase regulatory subunit [Ottowia testudinis]QTD44517.1 ATP phosphoribosyltransferase regulatory subunit [Ottowia testudinis]
MSAWLLPDHIADVLPSEARHIEELRRRLLDTACTYGYELVIPPLIEHLDSLLTGTGQALELQTFKLVDQLSGRSLGLRADTTPQVARIDAHLLGRQSITRLCYCGPVLHTMPERPHATREPLQFGAEIYGHAGREADVEVLSLALDCLRAAPLDGLSVDLADARIVRALLAGVMADPAVLAAVHDALAAKDASTLSRLTRDFPAASREGLQALVGLYGDESILVEAEKTLRRTPIVREALSNLKYMASRLTDVRVSFDLADARGYGYYTGVRFTVYAEGAGDAVLRGGRYDGVGAVFGHKLDRERPAVGFSLDVKQLARAATSAPLRAAIRAPWSDAPGLQAAVKALRARGETVVCALPGDAGQIDEFNCDRELIEAGGQWVIQSL